MASFIISFLIGYIIYSTLRKVYYEPKTTSAFFAIILFISFSLLTSFIFAPKTHVTVKYGINELVLYKKIDPFKSNEDLIDDLNKIIATGKDTFVIEIIRYNDSKYTYLKSMYPKAVLMLVNRNNTYLK